MEYHEPPRIGQMTRRSFTALAMRAPSVLARSVLALSLFGWSFLALAVLTSPASAERRVALVLGNSGYKNPTLALVNAKYDAQDVAAALTGLGFEVLLETDADMSGASKAIQQFARMAVGADAALFFYAGHALQYQGHNYLLPIDADVKDEISLPFETIAVDNIRAVLDRSDGVKIMVLDACRNNPIADRLAKLASLRPTPQGPPAERTRGLGRIDKAEGLIVAYATSPDEVALDGQDRNSPFTKAFLRRLNEPGLEIETLFRRVANDVNLATEGRQRPETYVSLVNEYYLNQNDRIAWEKLKDSEDPAALRGFIEQFPSSFYAIEARYRLQAVERAIAEAKERASREAEAERARQEAEAEKLRQEKERAAQEALARRQAEEACKKDGAALAATGPRDADGLRALAASASCGEVKDAAQKRLAELEAALVREAEACRRDGAALAAIDSADLARLRELGQTATCPSVKSAAAERVAALEAAKAKEAELCRSEEAEVKSLARHGEAADYQGLRQRAKCPATLAAIDQRLGEMAAAAQAACGRDEAKLGAIPERDGDALRALVAEPLCDKVKKAAESRIAALETRLAQEAALCQREDGELRNLIDKRAAPEIEALRRRAKCPATLAAIDRGLRDIAAAADAACARDNEVLKAIGPRNVEALRGLADRTSCPAIKAGAEKRRAEAEAALAHEAEVCAKDEAEWKAASKSKDPAALADLRRRLACPTVVAAIDHAIGDMKALCSREQAAFAALGAEDAEGTKAFLAGAACEEVKTAAKAKVAKIEAEQARLEEACRREDLELTSLETQGADARERLIDLKRRMTCVKLRPLLDAALEQLPASANPPKEFNTAEQIRAAQAELQRLSCLKGRGNGRLDEKTRSGLDRYFAAAGRPAVAEVKITDEFLNEMRKEKDDLCVPPEIRTEPPSEARKPHSRKNESIAHYPTREEPVQRPAESKPPRAKAARPVPVERPEPQHAERREPRYAPPARAAASANPRPSGGGGAAGGAASPLGVGF